MEKAVPFATGYRFKVKENRSLALQYELSMNFSIEDCEIFNKFILSLSIMSIIYNIIGIFVLDEGVFSSLLNYSGLLISVFGVFVYIRCQSGYKALKGRIIKKNSIFLGIFLGLQFGYFSLMILGNVYGSKVSVQMIVFGFFLVCVVLSFILYFLIVNFDLVTRIKQFHSLN